MTTVRTGTGALHDMRVRRRRNRVAAIEWFEALYRVYIAAFLGLWVVLFLSDLAGGDPLGPRTVTDIVTHGPGVLGLFVAVLLHLGASSGAAGGPLSLEPADASHVLLAPVSRGAALRRPLAQRMRTVGSVGMLVGAVAGQLLGRRMPDAAALPEWSLWGGLAGGTVAVATVAVAVMVHASRLPRVVTSAVSAILVAWQAAALEGSLVAAGPFDRVGAFALWAARDAHLADAVPIVVALALVPTAFAAVGALSAEHLAVRGGLVSQLRFAVTLQDIRTVVLLRRQLSAERPRRTPWVRVRGGTRDAVTVRALRGLARTPARRLARMTLVAAAGGAALVPVWRGAVPFVVVAGCLFFVLGLELLEPLSQHIDLPDTADSLPIDRGTMHVRHLIAPGLAALCFVPGTVLAVLFVPLGTGDRPGVFVAVVGAACAVAGGLAGATLNIVAGAPDPAAGATRGLALPPEVSGMGTVLRTAWPPSLAVAAALVVTALRETNRAGDALAPTAVRTVIAVALTCGFVAAWVHRRDDIRAWFDSLGARPATTHDEGGVSRGHR